MDKTILFSILVGLETSKRKQVQYLDFDFQFSSFVSNLDESRRKMMLSHLNILHSLDGRATEAVLSLISGTHVETGGIVILDSVNTLQTMLIDEDKPDWLKANHEASILFALLSEFANRNSKALVISSIEKPRPRQTLGRMTWELEVPGGRMIRFRSDAIFTILQSEERYHSLSTKADYVSSSAGAELKEGDVFNIPQVALF